MQTRVDLCENIVRFLGISKGISISSICLCNYISKLINYAVDVDNRYCLIMDYANNGNLRKYLEEKNNHLLNWGQRLKLAYQISNGLYYLHSEEIIHRDLHDKNIVIHNRNAKITDFGNAKSVNTQTNIHKGLFGMIFFLAPELLKEPELDNIPFCKKTDIYSLGIIFWELSSGRPPFEKSNYTLCYRIIDGIREDIIAGTPEEYWKLYCKYWEADSNKRPDIEYVYDALHKLLEAIENDYPSIPSIKRGATRNLVARTFKRSKKF
ncbi:kinase-like domain-containing protein [Gigaspora rosea]|uniref:Kinase-like domain-containing protein n=1 Tax=Gigaspora rosea TaxID=44941 RepID=A0A397W265_9GLOM|nr:kinase-like domain-containing protein [Gigaspora rosea]